MNISIQDVQAGKFFVCGLRVREIIKEEAGDNILYYSYQLATGNPLYETSDMSSKRQIARTAEREATADEIVRMKIKEARSWEEYQKIRIATATREMISSPIQ